MSQDVGRIPVQPTRIGELGIGSFLVLVGAASLVLCCVGSTFMKQPARNLLQAISTVTYGALIIYLTNAERRSRWEPQNDVSCHRIWFPPQFTFVTTYSNRTLMKVIADVDNMWLARIIVGVVVSVGSSLGIFKVFQLDGSLQGKEIVSENDAAGRRKKFLF